MDSLSENDEWAVRRLAQESGLTFEEMREQYLFLPVESEETNKEMSGFWWRCPGCEECGYVDDDNLYKYCPYCGIHVQIKKDCERECWTT